MTTRLRAATAAVTIALSCVLSGTAKASAAAPATEGAWYIPSASTMVATPGCGKGVNVRKVVATYKAKKYQAAGYRTDTLYCGNKAYGYRHLEPHIGQYFGGWASFSFAMGQTLKTPATIFPQGNGNFKETAPVYQCFFAGYYVVWTFVVIPKISSGDIVTAYGSKGKTVHKSCP